jgi:hypothetical protein
MENERTMVKTTTTTTPDSLVVKAYDRLKNNILKFKRLVETPYIK